MMKPLVPLWIAILMLPKSGQSAGCEEFLGVSSSGGSKPQHCNLTIHSEPSQLTPIFQTFVIRKPREKKQDDCNMDCNVHLVGICVDELGKRRRLWKEIGSFVRIIDGTSLEVRIHKTHLRIFKDSEIFVWLQCGQKICYIRNDLEDVDRLSSAPEQVPALLSLNRKLLSLESRSDMRNDDSVDGSMSFLAAVTVLASLLGLALVVALCSSCEKNVNDALSDEVGGANNMKVVTVSHVKVEESSSPSTPSLNNSHEHRTGSKSQQELVAYGQKQEQCDSRNYESDNLGHEGRTESNASGHAIGKPLHSERDKEAVLTSSGSQSSGKNIPHGSSSTKSRDKDHTDDIASSDKRGSRDSQVSVTSIDSLGRNREASQSSSRLSKGSPNTNQPESGFNFDTNAIDQPDGGKRQSKSVISKFRHGSDKNKETRKSAGEDEQKSKFWPRRKSSKIKKLDDQRPKHAVDQADRPRVATPTTHHREHHPRDLPLPPPPQATNSNTLPGQLSATAVGLQEDDEYETVDRRRVISVDTADQPYASVDVKTDYARYDEVNVNGQRDREPSEVYDCIEDNGNKTKRVSSASDKYDVVQYKDSNLPPASADGNYAVVEAHTQDVDKLTLSTMLDTHRDSTGSDIYELVTDDVKMQTGAITSHQDGNNDYAVVKKNPAKRLSKGEAKSNEYADPEGRRQQRDLSTEGESIPQPPPVSSLITVADSVRRRTHSDDLETDPENQPHFLEVGKPMDYTYAKVDLSKKTRHSGDHTGGGQIVLPESYEYELPEGFNEGSDTPPPIPPSLYAELGRQQAESARALVAKDFKITSADGDYEEIQGNPSTSNTINGKGTNRTNDPKYTKAADGNSAINDYEEVITFVQKTAEHDIITTSTNRKSMESGEVTKDEDTGSGYYDEITTDASGQVTQGNHLYDMVITSKSSSWDPTTK